MVKITLPSGHEVLIDDKDVHLISQHEWYLHKSREKEYAKNSPSSEYRLFMHRLILNPPEGFEVDHINGNGLDNRRENLRVCTRQQNCLNSVKKRTGKRFKGVFCRSRDGTYYAQVWLAGKCYSSCGHKTELSAAIAYDRMATHLHGDFAKLNLS